MPFATNEGVRIRWEEKGQGPPLLLLMGFGHSHRLWFPLADRLAEHFRLIMVDNRGTGGSDAPPGRYTIELMAADALEVLRCAGIGRAHVFGFSLGSVIAQELAVTHPDIVSRLVLGSGAAPGPDMAMGSRMGLTLLLLAPIMPKTLSHRVLGSYLHHASTPRERSREALVSMRREQAPLRSCLRQTWGQFGYESSSRVHRISAPTLILHGAHDRLAPAANAELLHERIAGSTLVIFPDGAHSLMTDQPDRVVSEVVAFLDEPGRSVVSTTRGTKDEVDH